MQYNLFNVGCPIPYQKDGFCGIIQEEEEDNHQEQHQSSTTCHLVLTPVFFVRRLYHAVLHLVLTAFTMQIAKRELSCHGILPCR